MASISGSKPLLTPQPTWSDLGCKPKCSIQFISGVILTTLGFLLAFYSPANLADIGKFTHMVIGPLLATAGVLLILYSLATCCYTGTKRVMSQALYDGEQLKLGDQLRDAIVHNRQDQFLALIDQVDNLNYPYSLLGLFPLHYAAILGTPDMIRVLIEKGADPNAQAASPPKEGDFAKRGYSCEGSTPLHLAIHSVLSGKVQDERELIPRIPRIQALLDSGANKEARDHQGWTPLQLAQELKFNTIVALLSA